MYDGCILFIQFDIVIDSKYFSDNKHKTINMDMIEN